MRTMARKRLSRKKMTKRFEDIRSAKEKLQYEYLTERHVISPSDAAFSVLDHFSHLANNVYNQGLYRVRQELFAGRWMSYRALNASMKKSRDQRDSMLYDCMKSVHLAQQVLKLVCQNMSSWKEARDAWRKAPHKFTGRPKLPHYRPKGGRSTIIVDNQTAKLRSGGFVEIPVMDNLRIELQHKDTTKIQQVRIVPQNGRFIAEIVYKTGTVIDYLPDNGRYLTIDPGLDNAFALATNVKGITPVLINGRPVKSVNQFYNKERARLMEAHDRSHQPRPSHRLDRLDFVRNQKIERFAHEASRRIAEFALSHGLNTIIIGKNKGQKRSSNMGRRNNQNFIGIPHDRMFQLIQYKANQLGIVVIGTNESYTSQTSFLDGEEPIHANGDKARARKGLMPARRRVKRGLYRSNDGTLLNADINGALQILRKVVPNAYADGIEGIGLCPVKLSLAF